MNLLGPRIGRFDEDLDYKNTKKKLQMLSKERASKKTKLGKKYRQMQKKNKLNDKTPKEGRDHRTKKKGNKAKKAIEKVKKNGYESFGSDENVDDQYKKTKAMTKQRQAFYFSGALPLKDRI